MFRVVIGINGLGLQYIMKMKKTILALLLAGASASAFALPFDKYSLNRDDLPEEAREFLTTHFPKGKVSMIKVDKHLLKKTDYDVKLVNGTKIEFNNAGKWTSVDCKTREVPEALVIRPIRKYIERNFPDTKIVKIEKKTFGFELELSDGIEVKFDHLGTFKSVEMND